MLQNVQYNTDLNQWTQDPSQKKKKSTFLKNRIFEDDSDQLDNLCKHFWPGYLSQKKYLYRGKSLPKPMKKKKKKNPHNLQEVETRNYSLQQFPVGQQKRKEMKFVQQGQPKTFWLELSCLTFTRNNCFFFLTFFNGYNLYESGTRGAMHTTKHSKLFQCPALQYQINQKDGVFNMFLSNIKADVY